jgi:hypothetical protein
MNDKIQKIKEEIEKRLKSLPKETEHEGLKAVYGGIAYELTELLQFIDSIEKEPASEDLEEYAKKLTKGAALDKHNLIWMCKKGAEWQKQQMKEALQTEYEKGRFDMREEMMKNAVECVVEDWCGDSPEITIPLNPQDFKMGDKVKIIIVKEEQ